MCRVCDSGEIETEEHFLIKCKFYDNLKLRYQLVQCENMETLLDTDPQKFGRYLIDAFEERKIACEPPFSWQWKCGVWMNGLFLLYVCVFF